jgi:formylglycine-generating enzyme
VKSRQIRQLRDALFAVAVAVAATPLHAITIDMVPIGNPGNGSDITGHGSVAYHYQIGKTEVTLAQYTAFLNAVAADDPYELYDIYQATDWRVAGIVRSGSPGSYSYSTIGSPNRPVTRVDWGDAARFANWMHNGQPTGAPTASTTEDGAYTLNGVADYRGLILVTRNPGARWFVPSEDEWYKAAYHKNDGITSNYWRFPTGSDTIPASDNPPGEPSIRTNVANFYHDDFIENGFNDGRAMTGTMPDTDSNLDNVLNDVGAYSSSPSPYGTFDQGGNVVEWNDSIRSLSNYSRVIRGGSWIYGWNYLAAGYELQTPVDETSTNLGFRLAAVPEPSASLIALSAALGFWWLVRRRILAQAAVPNMLLHS